MAKGPHDVIATPCILFHPARCAGNVVHDKRPALLSVGESVEDNDRHPRPFRSKHFPLTPLPARVPVSTDSQERACRCGRIDLRFPVDVRLNGLSIEEVPQAGVEITSRTKSTREDTCSSSTLDNRFV